MKTKKSLVISLILVICLVFCSLAMSACDALDIISNETATTAETKQSTTKTDSENTETASDQTTATSNDNQAPTEETATDEQSGEESDETTAIIGYEVTFVTDENVTITVYPTQNLTDGTVTDTAYAKDGDTGEILADGEGQLNFVLTFDTGYELGSVTITDSEGNTGSGYKNLKVVSDGIYRITKVSDDLTVTVESKLCEESEDLTNGYQVTFVGDNVTVYLYRTQDISGEGTEGSVAYSRVDNTGTLTKDGTGQVNFVIVPNDGYTVTTADISIDGSYKNLKEITDDNGDVIAYRITKIASDLTVTISAK